jgi:hypothetical protein
MFFLALLVVLESSRIFIVDLEGDAALICIRGIAVVEQLCLFRGSTRRAFRGERVVIQEATLDAVGWLLLFCSRHFWLLS